MTDKAVQSMRKKLFKSPLPIYESKPLPIVSAPTTDTISKEDQRKAIAEIDTAVMSPVLSVSTMSADVAALETIEQPVLPPSATNKDVATFETIEQPMVVPQIDFDSTLGALQTPKSQPLIYTQPSVQQSPISNDQIDVLQLPASQPLSPLSQPLMHAPLPTATIRPPKYRRPQKVKKKRSRLVNALLLFCILLPLFTVLAEGVNVAVIYNYAHDGIQHLLNVKDVFTGLRAHPTGFLDTKKLQLAQQDLIAAHTDFQQLHDELSQDPFVNITASMLPQQISSAHALSQIGVDVTDMGVQLTHLAITLAPSLQGSLLTDTKKPLVTPTMMALIKSTIEYLLPRLSDIQLQAKGLSLGVLPISDTQKQQLAQLLQAIPQAQSDLTQVHNLLDAASWILGVNQPRTLLVQTMDRAELRPTGGFTGQYGELQVNAGRVAPFSLKNIGPVEENNPNSPANGKFAPDAYRSWWPVPNWGLRDSNLSADFPTSARIAIGTYKYEFNHSVDGVVLFSPFLIARVLQVTGSISIPAYHETITSQNLEERLHYYQLDNTAIRKEELIEHVEDPVAARKLFTSRVATLLMDQVRHAPPDELITIGRAMLHALKTKDLQVYVTNSDVEALLVKYGAAAQMDRSTTHDGLYVVQANVSASKASQYVRTILHDVVTLNAHGGATHVLQMRLVYDQVGPVYGLDTYHDYVRIYVPKNSTFLSGNGFDAGVPLCGGPYAACPSYDIYQNGVLLCPAGAAISGAATSMFNDPYSGRFHPMDQIGPPTNMTSDESGRAMFGGWVIVPKNCTMTVSLSWYVPPMGHGPYALLIQRQSSTFSELDLTIIPTPSDCDALKTSGKHIAQVLGGADLLVSLKQSTSHEQPANSCYPQ